MKQFVIIGIGNFGRYLSVSLHKKGHDVMVIDKNHNRIQEVKDEVGQAIVGDSTNPATLKGIGIQDVDTVVVCMGSNLGNSILTAMNVLDLGVKKVMAKATNESHEKILKKLGVTEIFSPERDLAVTIAEKLCDSNMIEYLPLVEGHSIIQISAPKGFIGKSLKELDLINRFGVQVIAIKRFNDHQLNLVPKGNYVVEKNNELVFLGTNEDLEKLKRIK